MRKAFRKLTAGCLAAVLSLALAVCPLQAAPVTEPVTISYLQKILAEKSFEAPVNALLYKTFRQLEMNYDSVYAYGKTDRDTYLRAFCDTVAEKLDTVIYADGEEKDAYFTDVLLDAGAAAYTKNGTIVLRPMQLDMDHVNLAHEIEHLNNEFSVTVNLEADSDRFTSPLHEGMAARAEDFADPYPVRAMDLWEAENGRTVQIFKEIIKRDTEYIAVYQVYECLTEHLEILLGHSRLTEIIHGDKDVAASLRTELLKEFSAENTDAFLVSFFTLLYYTGAKDLRELDMEEEELRMKQVYRPLSALYTALTEASDAEIRKQYTALLQSARMLAAQYEDNLALLQKNTDLTSDEKKDYSDDNTKLMRKVLLIADSIEEKLNTFTHEDFLSEIRFYQALYAGMLDIGQRIAASRNPNDVLWDAFHALETDCQTLLLERIQTLEDRAEIPVLRQAFRYYAENVLISCMDDGNNVTAEAFRQIRYSALHRQELLLNRKTQSPPHHKCGIFTPLD